MWILYTNDLEILCGSAEKLEQKIAAAIAVIEDGSYTPGILHVENLDELMKNVYKIMKNDSEFVFSMSHPMATAYDGQYPRYTRSESGERLYANINNYFVEGQRKVTWVVDNYELYHRTFSSILNSIIKAGFLIEECQESRISDELRKQYPDMFGGTIHRPDFIFFRCRKAIR